MLDVGWSHIVSLIVHAPFSGTEGAHMEIEHVMYRLWGRRKESEKKELREHMGERTL